MALERSRYPPIDVSIRNKVSLIMKIPFDVGSIRGRLCKSVDDQSTGSRRKRRKGIIPLDSLVPFFGDEDR